MEMVLAAPAASGSERLGPVVLEAPVALVAALVR
jgi:hypothetical protein